jgi:hypothetical protein
LGKITKGENEIMKQLNKTLSIIILLCLAFSTLSGTIVLVNGCGSASKLFFSAGTSQVLQVGTVSNQITVQLRDASNNPLSAVSNTTVDLATNASSSGHFYSDQSGKNQIPDVIIKQGQNSTNFYYQDTAAGNPTLTASSQNINSATTQFTIIPANLDSANLDHFTFQPISSPQIAGLPFQITITAKDIYGNTNTSYTGSNIISDSTGTITPTSTTAFQAGVWSGQVTLTSPGSAVTISTSDSTHTGISNLFEVSQYTITASAGIGGSITPNGSVGVNYGDSQTFKFTPNTNSQIADVLVNGTSVLTSIVNGQYTISVVTGNTTISASFAMNTYTITVNAGANGQITPGTSSINYGDTPNFVITPANGFHISSITVNGQTVNITAPKGQSYRFSPVTSDGSIAATFEINTYTIVASSGNGGSINPSGNVTLNYGNDQTFTIAPANGYHIANVIIDGSSIGTAASESYSFTKVIADHTISATFTVDTASSSASSSTSTSSSTSSATLSSSTTSTIPSNFKITVISAHGSPTPSAYVNAGANFKVIVTTPDGGLSQRWICTGFSIDGGKAIIGTSYTFSNVQAAHTITFNWQEQYYLNVTSEYGFTAGSGWYNSGSTSTFTVTSSATDGNGNRLSFVTWKGTGVGAYTGSGTLQAVVMNNPITETATWTTSSTSLYTVGEAALIIFAFLLLVSLLLAWRRRRKNKNETQNPIKNGISSTIPYSLF